MWRLAGLPKIAIAVGAIGMLSVRPLASGQNAPAPPGSLVDIGGRRLHQICLGSGTPLVVFENGAGAFSVDWSRVQADVSTFTRACSYDRAGYGWSDRGPAYDSVEQTVDDLRRLLDRTDRPPYVMVGASLGAFYVRAYQRRHSAQVAGIVFVDGTHDEGITFMSGGRRVAISRLSADELKAAYADYEKQAPRPSAGSPDAEPLNALSADLQKVRFWAFAKLVEDVGLLPKGEAVAESWRQEFTALRRQRLDEPHPLGDLPLVVLERGRDADAEWHRQQLELAGLSTAGKHLIVERSGHMIHLYRPDAVVAAVREVVDAARRRGA